jgi:RNA polymerase sigma-70 factor (ECF subfamily)
LELEEAAIFSRCQAGDQDAFGVLVDRHKGVLFGTAYLMTRDRDRAEDAVQAALIQMWRHLPSLHLRGNLKTWLVRIVVNEVLQQRRRKRAPTLTLEQVPEPPANSDGADTTLTRDEMLRSLKRAMDTLPSDQRQTVVLRYFSDLTVPEIAATMGCREGTIKSRLSRALDRLGRILVSDETWDGRR